MSKKKKDKMRIEIEREDWKCMGVPRKKGGAGPHANRSTKRRRTRRDDLNAAINESYEES